MARYYGPGTGANRGFWALQWRDIKGRWIEMFGIGKYSIGGITHTGQVVGGDSENSIDVERRTANGKPTETVIDKIDPKTIEMMNVKATLDNAPGFDDDDMRKARNSENNRPKAATYPNGTKLTIDGDEHTKNDSDSWTDPSGDTVKNSDIDSRLDGSEKSSADIPQEADLTQENILSATDGSTLSWNDKTYDRIDGKWYDQKTGKPVSDNTMGKKTDGDLSTTGAEDKDVPSPTPASEYETGTKLHAEMNEGKSTADLHKTDDNEWDVSTEESNSQADDETVDSVIEASDTLDDFLQNPEESEPVRSPSTSDTQLNDEIERIDAEVSKIHDEASDDDGNLNLTPEQQERLESLRSELDTVLEDADALPEDTERIQKDAQDSQKFIDETLNTPAKKETESEENSTPTPTPTKDQEEADTPEDGDTSSVETETEPAEQTSLPKLSDVSSPDELEWESNDDEDGISQVETAFIADDEDAEHQITTYVDDDNSLYGVTVYPSDSDEDVAGDKLFETREEARQHALDSLKSYESNEDSQDRPATFTPEETEGGYQADPEKVDEELSAPDVETSIRDTQEAAENGTLSVEDVDPSADFTPTPDIEIRKETASRLNDPQEGDISVSSSGRKSEYKSGMWVPVDDDNAPSTSTEAQKKLNANGPETIKVSQDTETEAPRGAVTNRHGVELSGVNSPDFIQVTNQDGTQEVYAKLNGRWHRKLDSQGNYSRNHTDKSLLHAKLNDSPQVATKKKGERPVPSAKVTQAAPEQEIPKEAGLLPGGKHQAAAPSGKRPPLGSNITDRITKGEPNTVLEQDGKRVGFTDSEGTPYYVGDRVIFEDRSKNTRSARVLAVGVKKPKNENEEPRYFLDMAPDENDPETPEGKISFDEWYSMSQKEREDAGYHGLKYSGTKRMFQDSVAERARHAVSESKEDVANEHARRKEEGLVTGNVITEPEILTDASIDRVVRDASTRIIGTTNKHGELFQKGDVVEYGPNGEVGTITHVGEADDRIRIAPNGQSALEANFHHVDTIKHSETPATYYDENYDLAPADRVINDRFNQPVMIGDTIYRYGLPFEVKDIYPDGRKVRVVGKDWAGEQGSSASVQHSQLIDLGVDPEMARDLSSSREHDFMPDHIQVFTGDLEDIKSVRTHDSHMMTLTRDENGNVVDTAENRSAATSRAVGTKGNTKQTNSAVARYIAENGDQERYDRAGIKPGDMIDSGVDQAASDNLNQYVNTTFGSDLVIPDNSRVLGYNKYGQYETYTKKDNKWTIDGLEGGYEMSAQEFYQYRLENGYIPSPDDAVGDPDQHRLRLSYLGDADDNVVPRPGSRIKKTDDAAFALMPIGSIVRFEDAEGNIITIRKGADGKWYRVTSSGAYANNKGPVAPKDLAGTATYRGHYNKEVPLPKKLDTTSDEAKKDQYNRQKRGVARNEDRVNSGGMDRIYSRNTSSESTYRQGREDSKNVKDRRQENESIAQERDNLAKQNAELLAELERLRNQQSGEGDAVTASAPNRIVATRKGTDHVVAVYNRIDGNVWEYTSSKGHRREFVMETVPVTPGITYKVEENIA